MRPFSELIGLSGGPAGLSLSNGISTAVAGLDILIVGEYDTFEQGERNSTCVKATEVIDKIPFLAEFQSVWGEKDEGACV